MLNKIQHYYSKCEISVFHHHCKIFHYIVSTQVPKQITVIDMNDQITEFLGQTEVGNLAYYDLYKLVYFCIKFL